MGIEKKTQLISGKLPDHIKTSQKQQKKDLESCEAGRTTTIQYHFQKLRGNYFM